MEYNVKILKIRSLCEKQELNLRTPSGTDLESASVGHLDILAQNSMGERRVKGFHRTQNPVRNSRFPHP